MERPKASAHEGLTPALSDAQARRLLNAPPADTLKGKRDRAILSTLAHHALRRAELCSLKVKGVQQRHGLVHLRIYGKRGKIRFIPMHPETQRVVTEYLEVTAHLGKRYRAKTGGDVSGTREGAGSLQIAAIQAAVK